MKTIKIFEFHMRITKIINLRIPFDKYENHENHRNPHENHYNHEKHRNPLDNNENN